MWPKDTRRTMQGRQGVSTKSKARGTAAETAVVRFLQQWWPMAERRALSGAQDRGDVAGILGLVVEVKAAQRIELPSWKLETLREMENCRTKSGILVVKKPYKNVSEWDVHMWHETLHGMFTPAKGSPLWFRMDLAFAVTILREMGY